MKPVGLLPIMMCCLLTLHGCAAWPQVATQKGAEQSGAQDILTAESCRQHALILEIQGNLRPALFAWRVAARLEPDHSDTRRKIASLQITIADRAEIHFKKGTEHLQAGRLDAAQREMLITLRLLPEHAKALNALKTLWNDPLIYKVRRGDSLSQIAVDFYDDPGKAVMIAFYNNLDLNETLPIDKVLRLPDCDKGPSAAARKKIQSLMEKARQALAWKNYAEVLALTDPLTHPEALELNETARFALGRALMARNDEISALAQFKQLRPGYPGLEREVARARHNLQQRATNEKMVLARQFYDDGAYADAIAVYKAMLTRASSHQDAQTMLQACYYALGKQLLEQNLEIEAIDTLSHLDQGYQDTGLLLNRARARLNARAENHYREGVRFFLDEDLALAVAAWEKTLHFNPEHPKARQDMENAVRILEKVHGLGYDGKKGH
jgi:tetratricopeptide (TPR) repeat protein